MTATMPSANAERQQSPAAPASGMAAEGPPPEMMKALGSHIAGLAAMCPPLDPIDPAVAARLPIKETVWGRAGPEVLLVHGGVQGGLGGGPSTFDRQEALAADGWRVIRVDRPGFGGSPSRGPDDMQRDAVWIADRLTPGASLIGHSWGGAEALLAAARRPEAVRALVLVEPALELLVRGDPRYLADPRIRAANMKRFAAFMASRTPAEYGQAFRDSIGAPVGAREAAGASDAERQAAATRIGCAFLRARPAPVDVFDQAIAALVAAHVPVLVVSGGWSPSLDLTSEIVAQRIHGRHVVVPSPNHYVQEQNPADFNRVVSAFMKAAPPR